MRALPGEELFEAQTVARPGEQLMPDLQTAKLRFWPSIRKILKPFTPEPMAEAFLRQSTKVKPGRTPAAVLPHEILRRWPSTLRIQISFTLRHATDFTKAQTAVSRGCFVRFAGSRVCSFRRTAGSIPKTVL